MTKFVFWEQNFKGVRLTLSEYIRSAMRRATYEILSDGTYYGEIPGFQGVYANDGTLEDCRQQLQEVLEGWIVLGLRLGHSLPVARILRQGGI